jgi:hypothetical protein
MMVILAADTDTATGKKITPIEGMNANEGKNQDASRVAVQT